MDKNRSLTKLQEQVKAAALEQCQGQPWFIGRIDPADIPSNAEIRRLGFELAVQDLVALTRIPALPITHNCFA